MPLARWPGSPERVVTMNNSLASAGNHIVVAMMMRVRLKAGRTDRRILPDGSERALPAAARVTPPQRPPLARSRPAASPSRLRQGVRARHEAHPGESPPHRRPLETVRNWEQATHPTRPAARSSVIDKAPQVDRRAERGEAETD